MLHSRHRKEHNFLKSSKINWGNKTMLLVDDDYFSCLLVQELLNETKVKIIEAQTGEEAISIFRKTKNINLVLLDIKLPGVDGFEVCKQIYHINPAVPVIAYTASKLYGTAKQHKIESFDDILLKPVCFNKLFRVFLKYFN